MTVDLRDLATLVAVIDRGSIVSASRACGYSTAAVSRQMAAFQRRLGIRLFEPKGRSIRPLPVALELAALARPLLESAAQVEREMRIVARSDPRVICPEG